MGELHVLHQLLGGQTGGLGGVVGGVKDEDLEDEEPNDYATYHEYGGEEYTSQKCKLFKHMFNKNFEGWYNVKELSESEFNKTKGETQNMMNEFGEGNPKNGWRTQGLFSVFFVNYEGLQFDEYDDWSVEFNALVNDNYMAYGFVWICWTTFRSVPRKTMLM